MNLRQAVLREFYGKYIVNAGEMCYAFRAEEDTPEMSLVHQLVRGPTTTKFKHEKIHLIASREAANHACKNFEEDFGKKLKIVGDTYAVEPYVIGLARLGIYDEQDMDRLVQDLSDTVAFPQYVMNWLGTTQGYRQMFRDKAAAHVLNKTEDEIALTAQDFQEAAEYGNEKDPAKGVLDAKCLYVIDFAEDKSQEDPYVMKRMGEFINMMKPLTEKQLNDRLQYYFMLEDEFKEREDAIKDYRKFQPLTYGIRL